MTRVTVCHVKVFLLIFLEITRSHQLPTQGPRCTGHALSTASHKLPTQDPGALAIPYTASHRLPTRAGSQVHLPHLQHNTLHRKPPAAHTGTQVRFNTLHCKPPAAHTGAQVRLPHFTPPIPYTASHQLPTQGARCTCYKQLICNTTPYSESHQLPTQGPRCALTLYTASHQLPTQGPRCTCYNATNNLIDHSRVILHFTFFNFYTFLTCKFVPEIYTL